MAMGPTKELEVLVADAGGIRAETVHMRVNPLLTKEQRELIMQVAGGIGFVALMMLPGFVESFPWPF